jgi:fructose-1,6-bisphosphatase II
LGGDMQARLWLREGHGEEEICRQEGIDPNKVLTLDDLCASDLAILAATGVTDGELLEGVTYVRGSAYTQSLIISSLTNTVRTVISKHDLNALSHLPKFNGQHKKGTKEAHL